MKEQSLADATVAVVAHGLLNSITVIRAAATTLRERWPQLPDGERDDMLEKLDAQAAHIGNVLQDLVQLLPTTARAMLDALGESGGNFSDS